MLRVWCIWAGHALEMQLGRDKGKERGGRLLLGVKGTAWVAQVAELDAEPQLIVGAAPLSDHAQVLSGECVVADQVALAQVRSRGEGSALGGGEHGACGDPHDGCAQRSLKILRPQPAPAPAQPQEETQEPAPVPKANG